MMRKAILSLSALTLFGVPALMVKASEPETDGRTTVVGHRRAEHLMAVPISVVWTEEDLRKSRRKERREFRPECRRLWKARDTLSAYLADPETDRDKVARVVEYLANAYDPYDDASDWLANGGRKVARRVCRYRPDFALKVMELLAGPDRWAETYFNNAHRLIDLHEQLNRPESAERIREIKRGFWVRGIFYGKPEELGWTEAERLAFVARDDVWKFLNAQGPQAWYAQQRIGESYLNPLSPRFDLTKAADFVEGWNDPAMALQIAKRLIAGDGIAQDAARGERLLIKVAPHSDEARAMLVARMAPQLRSSDAIAQDAAMKALLGFAYVPSESGAAARAALIPLLAARLKSKDDKQMVEAAQALTQYAELGAPGAAEPLFPWIDRRLQRGTDAQKADAMSALARLVQKGNAQALTLFETELKRTGGLRDLGLATPELLRNRTLFTTNDYPWRAMRQEDEDIIGLTLFAGPDGRVIRTFVERGSSPSLIDETIRIAMRRVRLDVPKGTSRYVKVRLPDVQWRLAECSTDREAKPVIPGAIVVDSWCLQR